MSICRLRIAHPFIAVWDDHEISQRRVVGWRGRITIPSRRGRLARHGGPPYQAYLEWMPIRESGEGVHLYRSFRFGRWRIW